MNTRARPVHVHCEPMVAPIVGVQRARVRHSHRLRVETLNAISAFAITPAEPGVSVFCDICKLGGCGQTIEAASDAFERALVDYGLMFVHLYGLAVERAHDQHADYELPYDVANTERRS